MESRELDKCPHSQSAGMSEIKERSHWEWQGTWASSTVIMKPSHRENISSPRKTSLPGPGDLAVTKLLKKVFTTSPYSKVVRIIIEQ